MQATWGIWKLITEYGKYIGGSFGKHVALLKKIALGITKTDNDVKCLQETVTAFPLPVGRLYVNVSFTKAAKKEVSSLKNSYRLSIQLNSVLESYKNRHATKFEYAKFKNGFQFWFESHDDVIHAVIFHIFTAFWAEMCIKPKNHMKLSPSV